MEILRKIKRVELLIKLRQAKVDEESVLLARVRQEKITVVQAMKETQRRYMKGVEELNRVRGSTVRQNQPTLEAGLDYVKQQWFDHNRKVQALEQQEKEQIRRVLAAEQDLSAVEKLKERYVADFKRQSAKHDQKMMDEAALRGFNNK